MILKAAALAVLMGLSTASAHAQTRLVSDAPGADISPGEVLAIVRSTGLRPVSPPMLQGHHYVVHAVDAYGYTKRVVIDADMGEVVRIRPLGAVARSRFWDHRRPPPFGGGPRIWQEEAALMGPPPRPIGRPWRAPPPVILDDEEDDYRPPRAVPRPPLQGPVGPSAGLPPPPDMMRRGAPAPDVTHSIPPRTANVAPTTPPMPRDKPAAATTGARSASAPRVILQGGPQAKHEARPEAQATAPAAKPAVPPAPSGAGIPPAQGYE